ncbi:hypothetical protein C3941_06385 [Kaistia algarum]|uniref:DUF1697 domain-containing protein n=1 Tax=Kaistia algarum TaxID=2083279 RepID=UPI000CE86670|nr:DUF1697 domain-containing protein [Kaistia algarum]MCX5515699.1 DUF1697 domain-containing protein [Kaistia algarum]PPE80921.1 hypothetical protein C3941_06385 [Kaistia algarum]
MTTTIALLRAVNVGGAGRIAMADLRTLCEGLGLRGVRSLLQTGNLVFEADEPADAALERRLETAAREALGLHTDVFVRPLDEWREVLAANPFRSEAEMDPSHLVLVVLKGEPKPADVEALRAAIQGPERVEVNGRVLYVVYPDGIGTSKLTLPLIEKKLGLRGTGRNWNTAMKVAAIADG